MLSLSTDALNVPQKSQMSGSSATGNCVSQNSPTCLILDNPSQASVP